MNVTLNGIGWLELQPEQAEMRGPSMLHYQLVLDPQPTPLADGCSEEWNIEAGVTLFSHYAGEVERLNIVVARLSAPNEMESSRRYAGCQTGDPVSQVLPERFLVACRRLACWFDKDSIEEEVKATIIINCQAPLSGQEANDIELVVIINDRVDNADDFTATIAGLLNRFLAQ